jgi:hypothetical protein
VKATQKHKVRIVERRLPPRGAIISLAIALAASATVYLAWRIFKPVPPEVAYTRTLGDVLLSYECERNHKFNAPGQVGSLPCPMCQTPAYPRTNFECSTRHKQPVEVEFARKPDGHEAVARIRLPGGEWTSPEKGLRCPKCQSPLSRPQPQDLSDLGKQRPKSKPGDRPPPREPPRTRDRREKQTP